MDYKKLEVNLICVQ